MRTEYAQVYRELYEKHWWWRAREAVILRELRELRRGKPAGRVLDVGCGDGLFFDQLSVFGEVEGVEPDRSLLSPGSPYHDRIHVGPFDESFQPGHKYDLIVMLDVLEHIPDAEGALRYALNLLEPDGRIVLTVPAFPRLWTHHDDLNRHVMRYTRRTLQKLAARVGIRIYRIRYFFHWTFPAKLLVRVLERVRGPQGPERLPARGANRFLFLLSRAEESALRFANLPFGSSLLSVCGHP